MIFFDVVIWIKFDLFVQVLWYYYLVLFDFVKGEYEFLYGLIDGFYKFYSFVVNDFVFQWLWFVFGLMVMFDEVLDVKDCFLIEQNVIDVKFVLGLLFFDIDINFVDFCRGCVCVKDDVKVCEMEVCWCEILNSVEV